MESATQSANDHEPNETPRKRARLPVSALWSIGSLKTQAVITRFSRRVARSAITSYKGLHSVPSLDRVASYAPYWSTGITRGAWFAYSIAKMVPTHMLMWIHSPNGWRMNI